ncbi:hypothetical protein FG183_24655 (plasmid) [Serratia marcescens subsp. marcescens ATCC 13880]|nr:hypothetical protein FG183_24655 [Serratia marcescens subsp. marcescens ATCC 13880]
MKTRGTSNVNLAARGLANRRAAALLGLSLLGAAFTAQAGGWQWYEREAKPADDEMSPQAAAPAAPAGALQKLQLLQQSLRSGWRTPSCTQVPRTS